MSASASLNLSLPRTTQGDVDWDTLGNTLIEHLLAESLALSRVDTKFGRLDTAAETTDSEWQFDYEKEEIVVFRKKNKGSKSVSFSGRGVVNASYKVIGNFVKDIESTFLWDDYLVDAKYLKTFSQTENCSDYLGYQLHSTTHCFSLIQRDMLYFIRCQYKNGSYIMSGISIEDDDYPPQKFRPRCELHLGTGFVVEPFRGSLCRSLVTFFGNVDLKGLPLFITSQVLRMQPMAVKSIQRSFEIQNSFNPSSFPETSSSSSREHNTLPYEEDLSMGTFLGKTGGK